MTYTQPLLLLFLLIALAGAWRRSRPLVLAGLLGIFLLSWGPAAWLIAQPLEAWYPRRALPQGDAQAIVVLAGYVHRPAPEHPEPLLAADTAIRCAHAAWLYRNWRQVPVLASGGGEKDIPFAVTMAKALHGEGVPETLIWTEEGSSNTHENVAYSAAILRAQGVRRIALVTEAYHMLRSERCFRKEGFEVVPAPCGFYRVREAIPNWDSVRHNEFVLHELLGLAWYRARGWI